MAGEGGGSVFSQRTGKKVRERESSSKRGSGGNEHNLFVTYLLFHGILKLYHDYYRL